MLWIMVLGAACVVLGIFNAVWGFVEALMLRRARRAPAKADGVVCGLVRHRLPMRYEKQGDVPKVAYQYWGRTTANGAHGFLSIPQAMTQWNWYPCVRFTVNGGETEWIATGGSREGAWRIGQRVQVLYDPARPGGHEIRPGRESQEDPWKGPPDGSYDPDGHCRPHPGAAGQGPGISI